MTSQGKMLVKLSLKIGKESKEDASCVNASESGDKSGYQFKRKLNFSDASNEDIHHRAFNKQQTDVPANAGTSSLLGVVDDSDIDKDWYTSSDEEISSKDEFQKDRIDALKFRDVTEIVCTPDVTDCQHSRCSALSTSTASQTSNLLVSSTSTSNSNAAPNTPELQSVTSTSASTSIADISVASTINILSPVIKSKRKRNECNWKRNKLKVARNSGKEYELHSKKPEKRVREARKMKPPCSDKCRLKCSEKLTEDERKNIFDAYWNLKDIIKQREFIHNCTTVIKPKYRYVREGGPRPGRNYNAAFFFNLGDRRIRVCKFFFKNTLDINDRPIRTVFEKKDKLAGA